MNKIETRLCKSLHSVIKQGVKTTKLQIYSGGNRVSISGIRATIFGATGFIGPYIGAILGYIGSDLIFPYTHRYPYDDDVKELKLCAGSGQSFLVRHMNYDNPKMLDRVLANSNVVINLIGPRYGVKTLEDAEMINQKYARNIAQAVKRNKNILRYIHFSAAGAELDSPSVDLRTKAHAEREIRDICPDVTIMRPTTIYGMNDYFLRLWYTQREYLYHYNLVTDDCKAKRQPILVNDVAQAVLNALKLEESIGQTYELGGPHVYSMLDCYEIMHNIIGTPPQLAFVPFNIANKIAENFYNWEFFSKELMIQNRLDLIASGQTQTIQDLCVKPVSFPQGAQFFLHDKKARYFNDSDHLER